MEEEKHSGLGIAAFVMSLVFGVLMLVLFVVAGVMETSTPGGVDENSPEAMLLGLLIIGCLLGLLVALALGIAGLFQRERKKVFAILGIIFSGFAVFGTIVLMLIGLAAG